MLRDERLSHATEIELFFPDENAAGANYFYHTSPFNEKLLPFAHRLDHQIMRHLCGYRIADLDRDGYNLCSLLLRTE